MSQFRPRIRHQEFFGPQMELAYRLVLISQGPKNSGIPGPNPLPHPHVMYTHASKTLCTGCINHRCINNYYLGGQSERHKAWTSRPTLRVTVDKERPLLSQFSTFAYRESSHRRKSAAWHKFDMVRLYRTPIPVGRRGVFYSFKWFLPAFAALREAGGGQHPVGPQYQLITVRKLWKWRTS